MSELRKAAHLGPENPLPPLDVCMLHRLQDDYDRVRKERGFKAMVLENDVLRATFLTELGGRMWSLFHKPSSRELLYVNPVFQPANLAIRNAWFSGGVEWNVAPPIHARHCLLRGWNGIQFISFPKIYKLLPFSKTYRLPPLYQRGVKEKSRYGWSRVLHVSRLLFVCSWSYRWICR